jgi:hypothetical protein
MKTCKNSQKDAKVYPKTRSLLVVGASFPKKQSEINGVKIKQCTI